MASLVSQVMENPETSDGEHFVRYNLEPDEKGHRPNAIKSFTLVQEGQGNQTLFIGLGNDGERVAEAVKENLARVNITGEVNSLGTSFVVRSNDPKIVMRTVLALTAPGAIGQTMTVQAAGDIITHEYERTRISPEHLRVLSFVKEGDHETVHIGSGFSPVSELMGDSQWVRGGRAAVTHVTVHGDPASILDKLRQVDKWATIVI